MMIMLGSRESQSGPETKLLFLGLSHENVARILRGDAIHIRRITHGDAIPDDLEIVLLAGKTEEHMVKAIKDAGVDLPPPIRTNRLGRNDET